ncbi:MAG TPA: polysaccharide deacetylase family protein [Candidatus Didemnitutus sp.]|nr:polysaccharide deacetylase family protein [Candidatus Didemnitutus sp.]
MWLLLCLNLAGKIVAIALFRSAPWSAAAAWLIPDFLLAYHQLAPWSNGIVTMHRHFRTPRREVWLTIDDGPDPEDTPGILAALREHSARATFFHIGRNVAARPDLTRAVVEAGHEIGNHTHTHPLGIFWCVLPPRVNRELDDCAAQLRAAGVNAKRFRPPAGLRNIWLGHALPARRLECIGWSSRGLERKIFTAEGVADRVLRGLAPGSILLLHEGPRVHPAVRVHALRLVLERLRAAGYTCVIPGADQLV